MLGLYTAPKPLKGPPHVHFGLLSDSYAKRSELGYGEPHIGAFGTVFEAVHIDTGTLCAVKVISRTEQTSAELRDTLSELSIMKALCDHPNIVTLLEVVVEPTAIMAVTELCSGGSLLQQMMKLITIPERKAAQYMRQLLSAVAFCHKRHIVHRDIKLENLVLQSPDPDSLLKLIDFGTAVHLLPNEPLTTLLGTVSIIQPYYIAPEMLNLRYTEKCDVWSCGVVLFMMLSGKPPFPGSSHNEIYRGIRHDELDFSGDEWKGIFDSAKDLITIMLTKNPEKRPSASQLLSHPWLNTYCGKVPQPGTHSFLSHLAAQLTTLSETERLRETLRAIDLDHDGMLSRGEILTHLKELPLTNPVGTEEAMETIDTDYVDYSGFISDIMDWQEALNPSRIRAMTNGGKQRRGSLLEGREPDWSEVARRNGRRSSLQEAPQIA